MTIGIDVVLTKNADGIFDISIDEEGDIETADAFDTLILMSLFCERRASSSEVLESQRRRGWIGNESTPGFEIGSKLWLFEQSRINRNTLNGITTAADEALQAELVDDNIADSVTSSATLSNGTITLITIITRPNSKVEKRFFPLWENTGIN